MRAKLRVGSWKVRVGVKPERVRRASRASSGELVAVFGVDGFACDEGDAMAADVDGLGDEAFEMHLDAAVGGVPAGAVGEGVEVEVGVEVAVEAGEDVEVEGGGDAGGVVVGGEDGGDGLVGAGGEVGAEEEGVAGLEVGAEAAEDGVGFVGREVADAGADVEGEDAAAGWARGGGRLGDDDAAVEAGGTRAVLRIPGPENPGPGHPDVWAPAGVGEGVGLGDVVGDLGMDGEAGEGGGEVPAAASRAEALTSMGW